MAQAAQQDRVGDWPVPGSDDLHRRGRAVGRRTSVFEVGGRLPEARVDGAVERRGRERHGGCGRGRDERRRELVRADVAAGATRAGDSALIDVSGKYARAAVKGEAARQHGLGVSRAAVVGEWAEQYRDALPVPEFGQPAIGPIGEVETS